MFKAKILFAYKSHEIKTFYKQVLHNISDFWRKTDIQKMKDMCCGMWGGGVDLYDMWSVTGNRWPVPGAAAGADTGEGDGTGEVDGDGNWLLVTGYGYVMCLLFIILAWNIEHYDFLVILSNFNILLFFCTFSHEKYPNH